MKCFEMSALGRGNLSWRPVRYKMRQRCNPARTCLPVMPMREGWSWSVISSRTNLAPALPSADAHQIFSFDRPHSWDDDSDFFSDFEDRFCSEEATLIG